MIEIVEKQNCCGCTACAAICLKQCIEMTFDEEGFRYPVVDTEKCIQCGFCDQVCPVQNPVKETVVPQKAYLVQHKDERVRMDSSAGGAFTAIAAFVMEKGGVVFGAAYDENFQVRHTYVEKTDELRKFRNSKYVQSDMEDCFRQARDFLRAGRWVCFSGTPCQIEGLSRFLGKPYEKLVLIDVVCHGIPSPLVWNKYLEYQKVNEDTPDNIRFRDKFYGYKYSTMSMIKDSKNVYHAGSQQDPMLRAFFTDICDRPSCYDCTFKKRYRISDMTIWDCFCVYDFDKTMDDDKGTTRVLCHTEKGAEIMQELGSIVRCKDVEPDMLVNGVKEMFESVHINPMRTQFFKDAEKMSGAELFEKYYPNSVIVKAKTVIRGILLRTGVYKNVKRYLNRIRKGKFIRSTYRCKGRGNR